MPDFQVRNSAITVIMKNYSGSDVFEVSSYFETVRPVTALTE
jgi:hypothetical protein